ncbi:MAG: hypothetical protein ACOCXQ_04155 [Patescibacteria group bacterium]
MHPELQRIQTILSKYAKTANISLESKLSDYGIKRLFQPIVSDFMKGEVSLDDLSSLCEAMLDKTDGTKLNSELLGGAEIEWHIRHSPLGATSFIEDLITTFSSISMDQAPKPPLPEADREHFRTLLSEYEKKASVPGNMEPLSEEEVSRLFEAILADYQKGLVEIEVLGVFCQMVYDRVQNTALNQIIYNGTELWYDLRRNPERAMKTVQALIDTFLKKNSD